MTKNISGAFHNHIWVIEGKQKDVRTSASSDYRKIGMNKYEQELLDVMNAAQRKKNYYYQNNTVF